MVSQSIGRRFDPSCSSSALGQDTLSSLHSPLEEMLEAARPMVAYS